MFFFFFFLFTYSLNATDKKNPDLDIDIYRYILPCMYLSQFAADFSLVSNEFIVMFCL